MPRSTWLNPAAPDYQARRWARDRRESLERVQVVARGPSTPTDPGTQTDSVRVDPTVSGVAYVTTSVAQTYGGEPLVLQPSTLVRPDPVNPGVAYLTVTNTGP